MPPFKKTIKVFTLIAAALIGVAVPLVPAGIAVTQGVLGLALLLLLVATFGAPDARKEFGKLLFDPLSILMLILFLVMSTTVMWSINPVKSFDVIARTFAYIAGSALIWAHLKTNEHMRTVTMKSLIISGGISVMLATIILILPSGVWSDPASGTDVKNYAPLFFKRFSSALICIIPAAIFSGSRLGGNWRWLSWLIAPLGVYVMIATESRSSLAGLLAMIAVVAIAVIFAKSNHIKGMLLALVAMVAGVFVWLWGYGQKYSHIPDAFAPTWLIDPHRQIIWRFVFEKFLEAPFSGHGANQINYVPGADVVRADIGGAVVSAHPHNWVLEILSETGIVSFSIILTILLLMAWRLLARYRHGEDRAALAALALGAGFFGSSLFNFSIWSSWWLLSFFSLLALALSASDTSRRRKALFVVTEDWAFCSHRIPTALAVRDGGFDVALTAREGKHRKQIEQLGFKFVPWKISRKSLNPFREFFSLIRLINILNAERPALVYNVTLKPIVYGSLAAMFSGVPHTINLFSGLGTLFISKSPLLRLVRALVLPLLRYVNAAPGTWVMVQNSDDAKEMERLSVGGSERRAVVPGSGIDTHYFKPLPEPDGPLTAVLLSRMLRDKGVNEAVEAARILKQKGRNIRIVLVGDPDTENPSHIPEKTLQEWNDEGIIEWWGKSDDVREVWKKAHVALLPSYREGMPRSLLEGAASGRPLVAANSPGCRDLVQDGINGILVELKNAEAIADALMRLDDDAALRHQMGKNARNDAEKIFSNEAISKKIIEIIGKANVS